MCICTPCKPASNDPRALNYCIWWWSVDFWNFVWSMFLVIWRIARFFQKWFIIKWIITEHRIHSETQCIQAKMALHCNIQLRSMKSVLFDFFTKSLWFFYICFERSPAKLFFIVNTFFFGKYEKKEKMLVYACEHNVQIKAIE